MLFISVIIAFGPIKLITFCLCVSARRLIDTDLIDCLVFDVVGQQRLVYFYALCLIIICGNYRFH